MQKLKNVRAGILVIADAGLRLRAGQTLETPDLTSEMEALLASGHLVAVKAPERPTPEKPAPKKTTEESSAKTEQGVSRMTVSEAITFITSLQDIAQLERYIQTEKRRSVLDALNKRKEELSRGTG